MNERIAERLFYDDAWDDYLYWLERDVGILRKINVLIKDARSAPFLLPVRENRSR